MATLSASGPQPALAACAFARSFNTLLKYARVYGAGHHTTAHQRDVAWRELRAALSGTRELLLAVCGSRLRINGVALDGVTPERALVDLVGATGETSLQFLPNLRPAEFARAVQALAAGSARPAGPRAATAPSAGQAATPEISLPQLVEEALAAAALTPEQVERFRALPPPAVVDRVVTRFARCEKRQECERLLEILSTVGDVARDLLRCRLTTRPPAEAVLAVGPLSRVDLQSLANELPPLLHAWDRSAQDAVVRQLAIAGAKGRGLLLTLLLDSLDRLIRPLALDEIGLSGDADASPALLQLVQGLGPAAGNDFLRLKAIEALGRLRETHAADLLATVVAEKTLLVYKYPRELRIAAAQALRRIDPARARKVLEDSGLDPRELQFAPLEVVPSQWTRARRHARIHPRQLTGSARTRAGRVKIALTALSLAGGAGIRDGQTPLECEATLEFSSRLRRIRSQVLLHERGPRAVTFDIVNMDLEDLARLRRLLAESAAN